MTLRGHAARWTRRARFSAESVTAPAQALLRRAQAPSYAPDVRRIGLIGFYGFGNYGDELFADAFKPALSEVGQLGVLPNQLAAPYFSRPVPVTIDEQDAVVIGGGDLVQFHRPNPLYWNPHYLRRPVFIHGVGVPTYRDAKPRPDVVSGLRAFFQHPQVRHIGVRDTESADWIRKNLDPRVPIRVDADPVFSIHLPPVSRPTDPEVFGIVTRQRPVDHPDDYRNVQALAAAAQARGMVVRHIVLGVGQVGARDLANAADLDVPGKELVHSEDLDDLSRWIGECRVLASMKFHGTVVAMMYRTPSICLMPTPKNTRLLRRIGRPELIRHFTHDDLHTLVEGSLPPAIDATVVDALRASSREGLAALSDAIAEHAPIRRRRR